MASANKSSDLNCQSIRKIWIIYCLLCAVPQALSNVRFEAAFQGGCTKSSPCKQLCSDLHDGTHECACRDGYFLSTDGYSCIENTSDAVNKDEVSAALDDGVVIKSDFIDGRQSLNILRSASHTKDEVPKDNEIRRENAYNSRKSLDVSDDYVSSNVDGDDFGRFEVKGDVKDQDLNEYLRQQSAIIPRDDGRIYENCDQLECESGGVCVEIREHSNEVGKSKVRCKCPLGRGGVFCENVITLKYPRFVGWSYMGYPVLKDAYRSIQINMEFRPQDADGLLLYSGEQEDLVGDMISVAIVGGYIEFRFDCGVGLGMLMSDRPVRLNDWNSLTIYREGWKAWMQLNDGMQVEGRSRGLFSRITFRQRLYLGGSPNVEKVVNRTAVTKGFHGCVRKLEVNNHIFDFSVPGYVVEGVDVAECSADVCGKLVCQNGGQCVVSSPDDAVCLCPLDFTGKYCQQKIKVEVPHFNGSSYLKYPGLASTVLSFTEILIVFKPKLTNGVLLYNGYKPDSGDFIVINLVGGYVEFRFDLGTGTAVLRSRHKITMNEWHTVFISRTGRDGMLQVDNQQKVESLSPGAFTQLSLPLNLHLGGVSDAQHITSHADVKQYFTGCIQKVIINNKPLRLIESAVSGVNIDNCKHRCVEQPCKHGGICEAQDEFYTCHCNLGYSGTNCQQGNKDAILIPMFSGRSYLSYFDEKLMKRVIGNKVNVRLRFKSYSANAVLLWSGRIKMSTTSDYMALAIVNGFVTFQYNLGSGETIITSNLTRVDDGKWHYIQAMRTEQEGLLTVDDGQLSTGQSPGGLVQLNVNNGLHIGGVDDILMATRGKFKSGLVGCISNVTMATDYHVQLVTEATSGMNIQSCS